MNRPALDLSRRAFVRPLFGKGITVYGTWWRTDEGRFRPCLVLVPAGRRITNRNTKPCVVLVDDAHLWAEETGKPEYAYGAGQVFADLLGTSVVNVINAIQGELSELMKIPALPPGELLVVADAQTTDEHGHVTHREILERV